MKKRFLELLCRTAGFENIKVDTYRTDSCGGMYEVGVGYKITATDKQGNLVVNIKTPEGFNDAVSEVMGRIYTTPFAEINPVNINHFKV